MDTTARGTLPIVPTHTRIVALGSSFAAGPSIPPVADRAARRSGANYAHLLAHHLGASLTDLTVSGATTATILTTPQRTVTGRRFPPQVDAIPTDTDLITLTAGGNDLGYAGGMLKAACTTWLQQHRLTRPAAHALARGGPPVATTDDLERATTGLADIVHAARARAPRARVVLVDYLTVLGPSTTPAAATLTPHQLRAFRDIAHQLTDAFTQAAHRTGADLVHASTLSTDHALGCPQPWVTGFTPRLQPVPFHPTAAGMTAVADALHHHLTS